MVTADEQKVFKETLLLCCLTKAFHEKHMCLKPNFHWEVPFSEDDPSMADCLVARTPAWQEILKAPILLWLIQRRDPTTGQ